MKNVSAVLETKDLNVIIEHLVNSDDVDVADSALVDVLISIQKSSEGALIQGYDDFDDGEVDDEVDDFDDSEPECEGCPGCNGCDGYGGYGVEKPEPEIKDFMVVCDCPDPEVCNDENEFWMVDVWHV